MSGTERTTPAGQSGEWAGGLEAFVDLTVEVTDTSGHHTSGRLVGTGDRLRMEVADPAVVVAAAGRGATHGLGDQLARAGIRAELHGPHGRVARLDPDRTSRVGALLAGSPHVILDRAAWALPARVALRAGATAYVGAAITVAVVGTLWWRRRRGPS